MCVWGGSIILILMVYYSERTQIKISSGKRYPGQHPWRPGTSFQVFSSRGVVWPALDSPGNNVQKHGWNIANQECSPEPWCPESSMGFSHIDTWLTLVWNPSKTQADTTWPKLSKPWPPTTKSHHKQGLPDWPRSPGKRNTLIRQDLSRAQLTSLEPLSGPD